MLLRKIDATGSIQTAKPAVDDVALRALTSVQDRLKEPLIKARRCFDQNIIDSAVNQWHDRLRKCRAYSRERRTL